MVRTVVAGVAAGYWMNRGFQSSCVVTVNFDGTVSLIMGSVDIGGTRASIAQQTAETLGIAYEDVKPTVVDTDSIGFTMVTGGSRTSFATGIAAIEAAESVKAQMVARAARIWDAAEEDVNTSMTKCATSPIRNCASDSRSWLASWPPPAAPFRSVQRRLRRRGQFLCRAHSRRRNRPGYREDRHNQVNRHPGRRQGRAPQLRRGPDPGRSGPGHRLGAQRGVLLRLQRPNVESHLPRLPDAHLPRPAHDRYRHRRGRQPQPPLWRERRGRSAHRSPMAAISNGIHEATGLRLRSLPMSPGKVLEAQWEENCD